MSITNLSEIEIIELQYSLLEELKSKKTNGTAHPQQDADDFILQRFQDENNEYESDKHYSYRQLWFENGCCSYRELSKKTDVTHTSIHNIAKRYNWQKIKQEAYRLGNNQNNSCVRNEINTNDNSNTTIKRNSPQYREYHKRVLKRDKVCQCCGTSRDLEVHHPLPFKKYNSLGADPNNGIVLCKNCHSEYHSKYGYKRDVNPITLAQFLRDMSQQFDTKYLTPYNMDFFNESGDNGIFNRFSKSTIDNLSTKQFTILSIIFQEEEKHGKCSFELLHANKYCDFKGSIKEVPNDFEVISLQRKGLIYQPDNNSFKIV